MTLPRKIHLPAIGQLPTDLDPTLLKFLQAVKDILAVGGGVNTDHLLEKNVTRRDLEALGIDSSVIDNEAVEYVFGTPSTEASDEVPDPPTNFQLTQQVFSNRLTWTNPSTPYDSMWVFFSQNGIDYVQVAVITEPTSFYDHSLLESYGNHQYYKIQAVNTAGASTFVLADIALTIKNTINELTDLLFGKSDYYTRNYTLIADSFTVAQPSEHVLVWTDKNFLEGDIVTYGSPPGGGGTDPSNAYFALTDITAPADNPSINTDWKNLTNDEFLTLNSTRTVFKIGYVNGAPTLGFAGDIIVDGGILARNLSATDIFTNHLQSTNYISGIQGYDIDSVNGYIKMFDMDIDVTDGSFISRAPVSLPWTDSDWPKEQVVTYGDYTPGLPTDPSNLYKASADITAPADPPDINADWTNLTISEAAELKNNANHMEITAGDLVYRQWNGAEFVESKALKHIESEEGIPSGSVVTLPGYWFSVPIIRVFTDKVGIFDYSHKGDQAIECYAGNPTLDDATGEVTFTGVIQLIAAANAISQYPTSSGNASLWRHGWGTSNIVAFATPSPTHPCVGYWGSDYYSFTVPEFTTTIPGDRVVVTYKVSGGANGRLLINDHNTTDWYNYIDAGAVNVYLDVMIGGAWVNSVKVATKISQTGNYSFDYTNTSGIQKVRLRVTPYPYSVITRFMNVYTDCHIWTPYKAYVSMTKVVSHVNSATVLDSGTFSYIAIERN